MKIGARPQLGRGMMATHDTLPATILNVGSLPAQQAAGHTLESVTRLEMV